MKAPASVAIVGRPNVGKSTLFNRLTRSRSALVHPEPGVTRDTQRGSCDWNGIPFEVIDTGGLFSGKEDDLALEIERRAMNEALNADAMIFVTDSGSGITTADYEVAEKLREVKVPIILAANKSEKKKDLHAANEFFELGFPIVCAISALHGDGVGDLLDELVSHLPKRKAASVNRDLKLALVGCPNVGKSSLINRLVGSDSAIVDPRPGTTRDSIDTLVKWHGRDLVLVDTAGIKRKNRTKDGLSAITALKSIDAISRAEIIGLVLDASREISNQDVKVASYAHKAGKGIMICVNKWDLVDKETGTADTFEKRIRRSLRFIGYAPMMFVSALEGQRVSKIFDLAWRIKESRENRVTTGELNRYIEELISRTPPPAYGGGNGRIYYISQVDTAPPVFNLSVNRSDFFSRSYLRFLNNKIRETYGFEGTVIRIKLRDH